MVWDSDQHSDPTITLPLDSPRDKKESLKLLIFSKIVILN